MKGSRVTGPEEVTRERYFFIRTGGTLLLRGTPLVGPLVTRLPFSGMVREIGEELLVGS